MSVATHMYKTHFDQGGAKIKEIRESSGANIKAYQSCAPQVKRNLHQCIVTLCPMLVHPPDYNIPFHSEHGHYNSSPFIQSTDRVIALKGPRESLVPALRMCLEVCMECF